MHHPEAGGTLMGFILGLLLGLGIAVAVAVVLTRSAPEPKLKQRAPEIGSKQSPADVVEGNEEQVEDKPNLNKSLQSKVPLPADSLKKDPIGSIADKAQGPEYWLQTGAFKSVDDANRQKAVLAMQGLEAMISEREVDGATLWRVRVGPYANRDDVAQMKTRLQTAGVAATVIRINKAN